MAGQSSSYVVRRIARDTRLETEDPVCVRVRRSCEKDPSKTTTSGHQYSEELLRFLHKHEARLRAMAEDEAGKGQFTLGLSRCIDLLDQIHEMSEVTG